MKTFLLRPSIIKETKRTLGALGLLTLIITIPITTLAVLNTRNYVTKQKAAGEAFSDYRTYEFEAGGQKYLNYSFLENDGVTSWEMNCPMGDGGVDWGSCTEIAPNDLSWVSGAPFSGYRAYEFEAGGQKQVNFGFLEQAGLKSWEMNCPSGDSGVDFSACSALVPVDLSGLPGAPFTSYRAYEFEALSAGGEERIAVVTWGGLSGEPNVLTAKPDGSDQQILSYVDDGKFDSNYLYGGDVCGDYLFVSGGASPSLHSGDVYKISLLDGSVTKIVSSDQFEGSALGYVSASPDCSKISFTVDTDSFGREIFMTTAEGSNVVNITHATSGSQSFPVFLSSNEIAYKSNRLGGDVLVKQNVDSGAVSTIADLSPSILGYLGINSARDKFVFSLGLTEDTQDIFTLNVDGTNLTQVTATVEDEERPKFDQAGVKIYYRRQRPSKAYNLYSMNSNGSNQTAVLTSDSIDYIQATSYFAGSGGATQKYLNYGFMSATGNTSYEMNCPLGSDGVEWGECSSLVPVDLSGVTGAPFTGYRAYEFMRAGQQYLSYGFLEAGGLTSREMECPMGASGVDWGQCSALAAVDLTDIIPAQPNPPLCTITGPTSTVVGQAATWSATATVPLGGDANVEIDVNDQRWVGGAGLERIAYSDCGNTNSTCAVEGSYTFEEEGTHYVFCRGYNDGLRECRPFGPYEYPADVDCGPTDYLTVAVTAPVQYDGYFCAENSWECPAQPDCDTAGNNIGICYSTREQCLTNCVEPEGDYIYIKSSMQGKASGNWDGPCYYWIDDAAHPWNYQAEKVPGHLSEAGEAVVDVSPYNLIPGVEYYFSLKAYQHIQKVVLLSYQPGMVVDFGEMLAGDVYLPDEQGAQDGEVNSADFSKIIENLWSTIKDYYDLDGNGEINSIDMSLIISNWFKRD
ncbi:MAG: dockerin type I domain-containing protein [bacterium]